MLQVLSQTQQENKRTGINGRGEGKKGFKVPFNK